MFRKVTGRRPLQLPFVFRERAAITRDQNSGRRALSLWFAARLTARSVNGTETESEHSANDNEASGGDIRRCIVCRATIT